MSRETDARLAAAARHLRDAAGLLEGLARGKAAPGVARPDREDYAALAQDLAEKAARLAPPATPQTTTQFDMFAPRQAHEIGRAKPGVGVFVTDDQGRLLLERRADNRMWGPPGGNLEPGESLEQGALREVWEETGLTVRLTGLVGIYSGPDKRIVTYPDNGDVCQLVDTVFSGDVVSGSLRKSHESLEVRFFPLDELPQEIVPPAVIPLQDFLAGRRDMVR